MVAILFKGVVAKSREKGVRGGSEKSRVSGSKQTKPRRGARIQAGVSEAEPL